MTSERLGEMFEGNSADTCVGKIPLVPTRGGAERRVPRARTRERGPPSAALAEFVFQIVEF